MKHSLVLIAMGISLAGCGSTPLSNGSAKDNPAYPSTDDRRIRDQTHRMDPAGPDSSPDAGWR